MRFLKRLIISLVICSMVFGLSVIYVVIGSAIDYQQKVVTYRKYIEEQQSGGSGGGNGAMDIVAVARQELADAASNVGGFKYKNWYGMNADWCAMFVTWCADQCGYIDQGIVPKTAAVYGLYSYYNSLGRYHSKELYEPRPGDIIIYGISTHTGLVVDYDPETDMVTTIEGNTGSSSTTPYHLGSNVQEKHRQRTASSISGYCNPAYPVSSGGNGPLQNGESIIIPAGLGSVHTYMGWQLITSPSSMQYKLRQEAGMNFDSEGFGKIGGRYVIACTTTFGGVGDYVDFYQEDGLILECIIGDIKNQNDAGCNEWGHQNGRCIIEFVVDRNSWYPSHANPGTSSCHPEWNKNLIKAVNRGSYWG